MEIEMLKNLHETYKSQWVPRTERKINRLIQEMEDPKWSKILAFFQDDDVFDYSYIQSPSHALCVPEVVPNNEIGFNLYMPMEAPIFTCFFLQINFGFSAENTRYTISSSSPDKKFNFILQDVINHVKNIYPEYQYVPHHLLFGKRVDWGVPMGSFEKKEGHFIFEYFFNTFPFSEGDEMVVLE